MQNEKIAAKSWGSFSFLLSFSSSKKNKNYTSLLFTYISCLPPLKNNSDSSYLSLSCEDVLIAALIIVCIANWCAGRLLLLPLANNSQIKRFA